MNKESIIKELKKSILIIFLFWVVIANLYNYVMDGKQGSRMDLLKQQLECVEIFKEYDTTEIQIRSSRHIIDRPIGFYIKSDIEKKEFIEIIKKHMLEEEWILEKERKEEGLVFRKRNYIIYMSITKEGDWDVVIHKNDFFHKMSL